MVGKKGEKQLWEKVYMHGFIRQGSSGSLIQSTQDGLAKLKKKNTARNILKMIGEIAST